MNSYLAQFLWNTITVFKTVVAIHHSHVLWWCSGACDSFEFRPDICTLPDHIFSGDPLFEVVILNETTSSVCRHLCINIYSKWCSSVMYDTSTRACIMSPYTANLLSNVDTNCGDSSMEFLRRRRCPGKTLVRHSGVHRSLYSTISSPSIP